MHGIVARLVQRWNEFAKSAAGTAFNYLFGTPSAEAAVPAESDSGAAGAGAALGDLCDGDVAE